MKLDRIRNIFKILFMGITIDQRSTFIWGDLNARLEHHNTRKHLRDFDARVQTLIQARECIGRLECKKWRSALTRRDLNAGILRHNARSIWETSKHMLWFKHANALGVLNAIHEHRCIYMGRLQRKSRWQGTRTHWGDFDARLYALKIPICTTRAKNQESMSLL